MQIDGQGDVTATHKLWQVTRGSNVGSPVYRDGYLYWANDSLGVVYCVEAASGKVVYEARLGQRASRIYASPLLAGDRIYYVSRTAGTYVVAVKPAFKLLAQNVLADSEEIFNGSPAVYKGRLYLRSDKYLYCITKSDS